MKKKYFLFVLLMSFCIFLSETVMSNDNIPSERNQRNRGNQSQRREWMESLTEEQRGELKRTVQEMKSAGASREEIRSTVSSLLKSWGISPQNQGNQSQGKEWMKSLTEEQKNQLKMTVEEMKNAGATREEIKATVRDLLKSWGIKPQKQMAQRDEWMSRLTEEQKEEMKIKIEEMKNTGASKEEIKSAVKDLLKSWGITTQSQGKPDMPVSPEKIEK